jgi:hypothetical protein
MTVEDTDGLLDLIALRDLHSGPLGYYRHIADLFEKDRAYSYAVDFAKIAVRFEAEPGEVSFPSRRLPETQLIIYSRWGKPRMTSLTACFTPPYRLPVSMTLILHFTK